jgi:hypothetical protein
MKFHVPAANRVSESGFFASSSTGRIGFRAAQFSHPLISLPDISVPRTTSNVG